MHEETAREPTTGSGLQHMSRKQLCRETRGRAGCSGDGEEMA